MPSQDHWLLSRIWLTGNEKYKSGKIVFMFLLQMNTYDVLYTSLVTTAI
jgi:hypothetical protein